MISKIHHMMKESESAMILNALQNDKKRYEMQMSLIDRVLQQVDSNVDDIRKCLEFATMYPVDLKMSEKLINVLGLHLYSHIIAEFLVFLPFEAFKQHHQIKRILDPKIFAETLRLMALRHPEADLLIFIESNDLSSHHIVSTLWILFVNTPSTKTATECLELLRNVSSEITYQAFRSIPIYCNAAFTRLHDFINTANVRRLQLLISYVSPALLDVLEADRKLMPSVFTDAMVAIMLHNHEDLNHFSNYFIALMAFPFIFWDVANALMKHSNMTMHVIHATIFGIARKRLSLKNDINFVAWLQLISDDTLSNLKYPVVDFLSFVYPDSDACLNTETLSTWISSRKSVLQAFISQLLQNMRLQAHQRSSVGKVIVVCVRGGLFDAETYFDDCIRLAQSYLCLKLISTDFVDLMECLINIANEFQREQIFETCTLPAMEHLGCIRHSEGHLELLISSNDGMKADMQHLWKIFIHSSVRNNDQDRFTVLEAVHRLIHSTNDGVDLNMVIFICHLHFALVHNPHSHADRWNSMLYDCVTSAIIRKHAISPLETQHRGLKRPKNASNVVPTKALDTNLTLWALQFCLQSSEFLSDTFRCLVHEIAVSSQGCESREDLVDGLVRCLLSKTDSHGIGCGCAPCKQIMDWKFVLITILSCGNYSALNEQAAASASSMPHLRIRNSFGYFMSAVEVYLEMGFGIPAFVSLVMMCGSVSSAMECQVTGKIMEVFVQQVKIVSQTVPGEVAIALSKHPWHLLSAHQIIAYAKLAKLVVMDRLTDSDNGMILRLTMLLLGCHSILACDIESRKFSVDILYEFVSALSLQFGYISKGDSTTFPIETGLTAELICATSAWILHNIVESSTHLEDFEEALEHFEKSYALTVLDVSDSVWCRGYDRTTQKTLLTIINDTFSCLLARSKIHVEPHQVSLHDKYRDLIANSSLQEQVNTQRRHGKDV